MLPYLRNAVRRSTARAILLLSIFAVIAGLLSAQCTTTHSYPAYAFDFPQLQDKGERLEDPDVVLFVAPDDPSKHDVVELLTNLRGSPYWDAVAAEYGVGSVRHVTVADIPALGASVTTADLEHLVGRLAHDSKVLHPSADRDASASNGVDAAVDAGPLGPPPNVIRDTIYVLVLPETTTISDAPCTRESGYHSSAFVTSPDLVPFIVVPTACHADARYVLTHELVETFTDPFPYRASGLLGVDDAHLAWELPDLVEVADLCFGVLAEDEAGTTDFHPAFWSTKRAAAGKSPCVPHVRPIAFAMPLMNEDVLVAPGYRTRGVTVALNESVVVPVQISTDQPTESLPLTPFDVISTYYGQPPELALSFMEPSAVNGDIVHLIITRIANPTGLGGSAFLIVVGDTGTAIYSYGFAAVPVQDAGTD